MKTFESPRLLLSIRSLSGVSLATRDRTLEVSARFREPESLAVTLSKAVDVGVDGVLASPSAPLRTALAELKRGVPLYAVLPALSEHERHELEPGVEDPLARAQRNGSLAVRARLGLAGLLRPAGLFRGNFVARVPMLIEAEAAAFPARDRKGVVLDPWLTDLALAAGHRRFFESYCRFVRGRLRAAAGFETHNLGLLLARLREWSITPDLVVGPLNPCGVLMKPSPSETLEEIARSEVPVVAKELRAGGVVSLEEGARYAREHGAHGLAPDVAELDDVGSELRALNGGSARPALVTASERPA